MYKHIVFEGTSTKGLAFCGALQLMEEQGTLQSLTHFAGVSSGAIFATMLALCYSPQEMIDFFTLDRMSGIIPRTCFLYRMYSLVRYKGLYSQRKVKRELITLLRNKFDEGITFKQLYEKTGHVLVIGVTDMETHSALYLNPHTTPDVLILDALLATICLPLFFVPKKYKFVSEPKIYIDGGMADDFPIWIFNDEAHLTNQDVSALKHSPMSPQTLGMEVTSSVPVRKITGWISFLKSIVTTILVQLENIPKKYPSQTIDIPMDKNQSALDFDLTQEDYDSLLVSGHETAEAFFNN